MTRGRAWLIASFMFVIASSLASLAGPWSVAATVSGFAFSCLVYALLLTLRRRLWVVVVAFLVLGELFLVRSAELQSWETVRVVIAVLSGVSVLMLFAPPVRRELR